MRDALTRLDHEGLVRTLPRKGYQVAPITPKSVDDLFITWAIIGPELMRLGITRASDEQIAAAIAGFDEIEALAAGNPGGETALRHTEAADRTFTILATASDNANLIDFYQRLSVAMGRVWALILSAAPDTARRDALESPAEHWLPHVLAHRVADDAAETARAHIDMMHKQVLAMVVRWPSVMTSEVVVPLKP